MLCLLQIVKVVGRIGEFSMTDCLLKYITSFELLLNEILVSNTISFAFILVLVSALLKDAKYIGQNITICQGNSIFVLVV